uniref:Retrotransposon gag domain-containing protein n=1 Tax=Gasterosteus aculeatus aculeatus TaxID=481459 RepID=A0AAQ4Q1R1_GASAC
MQVSPALYLGLISRFRPCLFPTRSSVSAPVSTSAFCPRPRVLPERLGFLLPAPWTARRFCPCAPDPRPAQRSLCARTPAVRPCSNKALTEHSVPLCCIWLRHTLVSVQSGHKMEPAHTGSPQQRLERVEGALVQHEAILTSTLAEVRQATAASQQASATQEQTLTALVAQIQQLTLRISQTESQSPPAAPPAAVSPPTPPGPAFEPRIGAPERYGGDPESCSPFLTNCSILFALQPHTFASEEARVAFTINHLTGRARLWGTAEWERQTPACRSFQSFAAEVRKVFGPPALGPDAAGGLLNLHQGDRAVADYAIDFRTRARQSRWNTEAQCDAYLRGLEDYVKDELVSFDLPTSLDELIELTQRVDRRILARQEERRQGGAGRLQPRRSSPPHQASSLQPGPLVEDPEPMQLSRTTLSTMERQRRRRLNLCMYCGGEGHFAHQ